MLSSVNHLLSRAGHDRHKKELRCIAIYPLKLITYVLGIIEDASFNIGVGIIEDAIFTIYKSRRQRLGLQFVCFLTTGPAVIDLYDYIFSSTLMVLICV